MASNSEEHVVTMNWQVNKDRIELMQRKISEPPRLLSKSAGRSGCCIFRAPQSFVDVNGRSYQPRIVSIGPYHRGKPHLEMIQEHKWRFLGTLLQRTEKIGLTLEDYFQTVQTLEMEARECYSEAINLESDEFVEILVLDGCFIIELFRKIGRVVPFEEDDPFISMSWIFPFLLRDFIRLENQIPFFILQRLFELTKMSGEQASLSRIALFFFNHALQRPEEILDKYENLAGKHLLDFLRSSFMTFIPPVTENPPKSPSHVIHSISKLRRAGIKLRPGQEDSFLAIKFRRGVIWMPAITVDDFMAAFLLNCVAYEQCHGECSKHMTTYATLLDYLVNTYKDVEYLSDCNIVENYFGTDSELATLINKLGKDVMFDIDECYLAQVFDEIISKAHKKHYY
ncbi:PREDICTED: UPF0481 protein At3g47200 isoform X2 [Ipomoea nil]|uniref:UPF0481 protein At3g47200 isoform X2 n=1 Tax=Ipomoea nil TaxID=35883 RepID=UPI000901C895|nr:PREDICTED: UPF0481 protein At3g47200 isoform X2 [Ipomoea nil]